jgi:hypothetical protein
MPLANGYPEEEGGDGDFACCYPHQGETVNVLLARFGGLRWETDVCPMTIYLVDCIISSKESSIECRPNPWSAASVIDTEYGIIMTCVQSVIQVLSTQFYPTYRAQ